MERFTALLAHVDVDMLRVVSLALKRRAIAGMDGVTWEADATASPSQAWPGDTSPKQVAAPNLQHISKHGVGGHSLRVENRNVMQQGRTGRRRGLLAASAAVMAAAIGGVVAFELLIDEAAGSPKPADKPARAAATPAATAPEATAELQPTQHARNAGVHDCLQEIDEVSRLSVAGSYTAVSTWNQGAPNDRLFNSIVGQSNDNKVAPKAVSVVVTSPGAQRKCDATAVEVHPSALSCPDIERTLAQDKREQRVTLSGIPLLQTDPSLRYVLLPAPANGCVVVGVRTLFGK